MKTRRYLALAMMTVVGLAAACAPPPAPSTIDQDSPVTPGGPATLIGCTPVVQTFTAGRTGMLDTVSVIVLPTSFSTSFNVAVAAAPGGVVPLGFTSLGSGSYAGPASASTSTYIDVPVSPTVSVVAGQEYGLVFDTSPCSATTALQSAGLDSYPGGKLTLINGTALPQGDLNFRTWVL